MSTKIIKYYINVLKFIIFLNGFSLFISAQTHIEADPYYLLISEKNQFNYDNNKYLIPGLFRPFFYKSDSTKISISSKFEFYLNNNSPNQENMDVRYFSKGLSSFNSFRLSINSPFIYLIAEPYFLNKNNYKTNDISRYGPFAVLNDREIKDNQFHVPGSFRNLLLFVHFKGIGFGFQQGNRWWGPGIHTSLQMTNNTQPIPANVIGTMNEIRLKKIGLYLMYSFSKLNQLTGYQRKYFTSLNGRITWYGAIHSSIGFSRNYLTGGENISNYTWKESDAKKIVFEELLTSNLLSKEYTLGGHDLWDQTLSFYFNFTLPQRQIKLYIETGFNDNRMYFADLLSQPDHSMATIIGIRDYGIKNINNFIWGFEWTNLMITYTSKFRPTGPGTWYNRVQYGYSTFADRRWGAHSGTDSDDWFIYGGYLSDKLYVIPSFNYERHGIVSHRPAEVKVEYRLDIRFKKNNFWFGAYYERQFEAFLGFPDYFYVDKFEQPINSANGNLANSRHTNTLIFTISSEINIK